jgi:hypothetical protein
MESAEHSSVVTAGILRSLHDRISSLELTAFCPDVERSISPISLNALGPKVRPTNMTPRPRSQPYPARPSHRNGWKRAVLKPGIPPPFPWQEVVVQDGDVVYPDDSKHVHLVPGRKGANVVAAHRQSMPPGGAQKTKVVPERLLQKFIGEFNDYWVRWTGKDIRFKFTANDLNFLTLTDPARVRNMFLRKFFYDPPVILEAFGGTGADTITFLHDLDPSHCYVVQNGLSGVATRTEQAAFVLLQGNIHYFFEAFPELNHGNVMFSAYTVRDFIREAPITKIDLLYLDPPWVIKGDMECTPKELINFLDDTVFKSLNAKRILPRVICIKTRFGWDKISQIEHLIPKYNRFVSIKTQPLKGLYYFHIFAINDPLDVIYQRSSIQNETYGVEGGSKRVPIQNNDPESKPRYNAESYQGQGRVKYPSPQAIDEQ